MSTGEESQFSKLTSSSFNDLGIPYDTGMYGVNIKNFKQN